MRERDRLSAAAQARGWPRSLPSPLPPERSAKLARCHRRSTPWDGGDGCKSRRAAFNKGWLLISGQTLFSIRVDQYLSAVKSSLEDFTALKPRGGGGFVNSPNRYRWLVPISQAEVSV
jgi:hypothetical protein